MIYFYVKTFLGYRKGKTSEANFFFAFSSLIPFLYLLPKSYANKLEANWPAFAFVGLMYILVYMYWLQKMDSLCYFGSNCFSFIVIHYLISLIVIINFFKTYYEKKWIITLELMSAILPNSIQYVRPKLEAICVNLGNYHLTKTFTIQSLSLIKFFKDKDF